MADPPVVTEALRQWLERVEIVTAGVEARRAAALRALAAGNPVAARSEALAVLSQVPEARIGLAVWADAAFELGLQEEAVEALEALLRLVPFRADLWVRLADANSRDTRAARRALERAVEVGSPVEAADEARRRLADIELAWCNPEAALWWLDGQSLGGQVAVETACRRIEALLDAGRTNDAQRIGTALPDEPPLSEARQWLVRARLLASADDPRAALAFERALVLGAFRAEPLVCDYVARCSDAVVVARFRAAAEVLGVAKAPVWRAAFATAEGRVEDALAALGEAARKAGGDDDRTAYFRRAFETRHAAAFCEATELIARAGGRLEPPVKALARALSEGDPVKQLRLLENVDRGSALVWARERRRVLCRGFCSASGTDPGRVLEELGRAASSLGALEALREVEALTRDRERPLRAAIVGEFNAGKSSFINALLGEFVAPVGVVPTTATRHEVVWAPDRFARLTMRPGSEFSERIVPFASLAETLKGTGTDAVEAVQICAPIEVLRRVELIDTPGFNAPHRGHLEAAQEALERAHVAIWLIDATQAMKQSETDVLGAMSRTGIPLLVLVNKVDRLPDDGAAERVLAHVRRALSGASASVLGLPIGFSAKRALEAGGGGDPAWQAVLALIDATLVVGTGELRERAFRRRSAALARELERRALARGDSPAAGAPLDVDAALVERRLLERRVAVVERLRRELSRLEPSLAAALAPVADAGTQDAVARFIRAKVRVFGAEPLARGILDELGLRADAVSGDLREALLDAFTALVTGTRLSYPEGHADSPTTRHRLVSSIVDETARVLDTWRANRKPPPERGLAETLREIARELAG